MARKTPTNRAPLVAAASMFACLALLAVGCEQRPTHGIGRTVELPRDAAFSAAAVRSIVDGHAFKLRFIDHLPEPRLKAAVEPDNLTFKVWQSMDNTTMLDFEMPGYVDSDVQTIGDRLADLVEQQLAPPTA